MLLKDPAIFILDEATASVDPFTELQIQEGLDTIMRDRTAIVIAHRLSTVKNADRIIVMADGHIIEEGTHETLMAQGGHYSELYDTYFRHQSLSYKPWDQSPARSSPERSPFPVESSSTPGQGQDDQNGHNEPRPGPQDLGA